MSKKKGKAVAPKAVLILRCAACDAEAPSGTEERAKHKNCPKKEGGKPPRFLQPVVKKMSVFLPKKAVAGADIGEHKVTIAATETKVTAASEAESHEDVWAQAYKWTGSAWRSASSKSNTSGDFHAEQMAWNQVKVRDNWVGFVQNAPPCTKQCFEFFLTQSEKVIGIVFFVTADRGSYCLEYAELVGGAIKPPFALYMWKGVWSVNKAIGDAPTTSPV